MAFFGPNTITYWILKYNAIASQLVDSDAKWSLEDVFTYLKNIPGLNFDELNDEKIKDLYFDPISGLFYEVANISEKY